MNRRDFLRTTVYLGCALGMPAAGLARITDAEVGLDMSVGVPAGDGLVDMLIFNPPEGLMVGDYWRPRTGPMLVVKSVDDSGAHLVPVETDRSREHATLWYEVTDRQPVGWKAPSGFQIGGAES